VNSHVYEQSIIEKVYWFTTTLKFGEKGGYLYIYISSNTYLNNLIIIIIQNNIFKFLF